MTIDKCAKKDRDRGWVHHGYPLPPIWPTRADPMNIIMRNGKPRMTIDKTMQLVNGVASYNELVNLQSIPDIEYVKIAELARAIAILDTAEAPVKIWGFDLDSYFHRTGKQRRDCWMSGFVHSDGFGFDPRIQFGQREAPVLCGGQSCFLVWAIQRVRGLGVRVRVRGLGFGLTQPLTQRLSRLFFAGFSSGARRQSRPRRARKMPTAGPCSFSLSCTWMTSAPRRSMISSLIIAVRSSCWLAGKRALLANKGGRRFTSPRRSASSNILVTLTPKGRAGSQASLWTSWAPR